MNNVLKLSQLLTERMNTTVSSELPVQPRLEKERSPLVAVNHWEMRDVPKRLSKQYDFREVEQRDRFVMSLLDYEHEVLHHATMIVSETVVIVEVWTDGIDQPTELDKEYAKFADSLYRDVVYDNSTYGYHGSETTTFSL